MATARSPSPADVPLPRVYGRRTLSTLLRVVDALCPPAEVIAGPPSERVLDTVISFVPFLAPPLRYGLPAALWVFEVSPILFGMGVRRFTALGPQEAERYVRRWEHARPPLSLLYQALHSLVLACFYQQPEVLAALEIDWQGRAHELVERRGRLMKMSPELANPRNAGARRQAG